MKKPIIALTVISSLFVNQMSYADTVNAKQEREHTEELVGLSSGIVLGAVVGGPIGAFIGAVTGTFIGKSVGDESEIKAQQALLAEQQTTLQQREEKLSEYAQQQHRLQELQTEVAKLQSHQDKTLTELSVGMNVQFKTGSSQIEPIFKQQLDNVVYMMAAMPELNLNLMGYADRRGNDVFNQALSEQRLIEVTNYLASQGVDESRLHGEAFGASAPLHEEQNFENDFFDRRVTLKLISESAQLAAN
ncbi:sortase-associated OmpA-like protein PdsO [Shewanella gaetbuli]|uniref:Sortase-associated OmpA-like protein PdsO n=1 Tax=Shewanella gaetbuli TaxID=220752 RepID=A0A9X2CH18_9GAMM|nr:sortase-associated OmpA-like protein PdsO [Shewanella gaetbuli]MCL1142998.1 sortase-associated OmpA-like protein PdsO [Shewanella gaetbuli]